jgi:hypothetical protein
LSSEGVVIVRINSGAYQSLADAKENLAAAVSETGGARRPLLIDIRSARPLEADARHHYSGQTLIDRFSAMALLVEASPFGRMMGNVYLRIARPGIPTQLFADERDALDWLSGPRS